MMQKIAFVGNCQVQAIYGLYRTFAWDRREQELFYVASYEELDAAGAEAIAAADMIVEQIFDMPQKVDFLQLNQHARRIPVPLVAGNFLWPFAAEPHPSNPTPYFLPGGPYPREAGIAYLNTQIEQSVAAEAAVRELLDLDVAKFANLDRQFEWIIDCQSLRDEKAGYDIAGIIEQYIRKERLFLSIYHPDLRISMELASTCFERMGVAGDAIAHMKHVTRVTPFPKDELPVHPAIIEHFGMDYMPKEPRFQYLHGSPQTFREFATNYMRCEWNAPLEEGIALVQANKLADAEPLLRQGLERDPMAAFGYAALGTVQHAIGQIDNASETLTQAAFLDPANADTWLKLGSSLRDQGDLGAAEAAYRHAVAAKPYDAYIVAALVHVLHRQQRWAEAEAAVQLGLEANPWSAKLHVESAYLAERRKDWKGAADHFRAARERDPTLSLDEALANAIRKADGPDAVEFANAVPTMTQVVDRPRTPPTVTAMEHANELFVSGRMENALAAYRSICDENPEMGPAWLRIAEIQLRLGDAVTAEQSVRMALALDETTHGYVVLAGTLGEQRRYPDAAAICRLLTEREPNVPHLHAHLANALMRAGRAEDAVAAFGVATSLAPDNARFKVELSHALRQAGRDADALAAAQEAVALDPEQTNLRANLAQMLLEIGDHAASLAVWEVVCAQAPDNEHFQDRARSYARGSVDLGWCQRYISRSVQFEKAPPVQCLPVEMSDGSFFVRLGQSPVKLTSLGGAPLPLTPDWVPETVLVGPGITPVMRLRHVGGATSVWFLSSEFQYLANNAYELPPANRIALAASVPGFPDIAWDRIATAQPGLAELPTSRIDTISIEGVRLFNPISATDAAAHVDFWRTNDHLVVRGALTTEAIAFLTERITFDDLNSLNDPRQFHRVHNDLQCKSLIQQFLEASRIFYETVLGLDLMAMYEFAMKYIRNSDMDPHYDNLHNPISSTVCYRFISDAPNPLYIDRATFMNPYTQRVTVKDKARIPAVNVVRMDLSPGDIAVFRGRAHLHWRDAIFKDMDYRALLLHFSDFKYKNQLVKGQPIPHITDSLVDIENYDEFREVYAMYFDSNGKTWV